MTLLSEVTALSVILRRFSFLIPEYPLGVVHDLCPNLSTRFLYLVADVVCGLLPNNIVSTWQIRIPNNGRELAHYHASDVVYWSLRNAVCCSGVLNRISF